MLRPAATVAARETPSRSRQKERAASSGATLRENALRARQTARERRSRSRSIQGDCVTVLLPHTKVKGCKAPICRVFRIVARIHANGRGRRCAWADERHSHASFAQGGAGGRRTPYTDGMTDRPSPPRPKEAEPVTYRNFSKDFIEQFEADRAAGRTNPYRTDDADAVRRDPARDMSPRLHRPPFVRDIDKILNVAPYNRYAGKTPCSASYATTTSAAAGFTCNSSRARPARSRGCSA